MFLKTLLIPKIKRKIKSSRLYILANKQSLKSQKNIDFFSNNNLFIHFLFLFNFFVVKL